MTDKTNPIEQEKQPRSELAAKQRMNPVQRYRSEGGRKSTPMMAIAAFCYTCQGGSSDGDAVRKVQAAVRDCSQKDCVLWSHRGWKTMASFKQGKR